jgi:hypothetical protein
MAQILVFQLSEQLTAGEVLVGATSRFDDKNRRPDLSCGRFQLNSRFQTNDNTRCEAVEKFGRTDSEWLACKDFLNTFYQSNLG